MKILIQFKQYFLSCSMPCRPLMITITYYLEDENERNDPAASTRGMYNTVKWEYGIKQFCLTYAKPQTYSLFLS